MSVIRAAIPIAVLVAASLLAALPWGLASSHQAMLPMLVAGLVYLWNVRRAGAVPHWVSFIVGICLDAVAQGPLGYWPLVFLAASASAALARDMFRNVESQHVAIAALAYLVAMSALVALAWGLRSLFDLTPGDANGMLVTLAVSFVAYPILGGLVAVLEAATSTADDSLTARAR